MSEQSASSVQAPGTRRSASAGEYWQVDSDDSESEGLWWHREGSGIRQREGDRL